MSRLRIRDVPEDVRRVLEARAASAGQSLSEYVLAELRRSAERPTVDELAARVRARGVHDPEKPAADVLTEAREQR